METSSQDQRSAEKTQDAGSDLLPLVYNDLRKVAARKLSQEAADHTLQATALVHEAWLRISGERKWNSRAHFFSAAAEAMRRVLIERARRKLSQRRGGGLEREQLDESRIVLQRPSDEVLAVEEALERLEKFDPQAARLVNLRYFAGMSLPEAAATMEISPRTADRLWAYTRSWLRLEMDN